jgi:endonuclease YncB( thermonuclease family)
MSNRIQRWQLDESRLQYVVDGDTVRLRSDEYVRFIGVDAPESSECGGRASERVMNRLLDGFIRLKRPSGYQNRDGFERLLRYVHDFGRDAGRALIWRGFARSYDVFSHPRESSYRAAPAALLLWRVQGRRVEMSACLVPPMLFPARILVRSEYCPPGEHPG